MQCPVCNQDQVIVEYEGIELDVCFDGHGTWFDEDELVQLFEAAGVPRMLHDLERRVERLPRGEKRGPPRRCPRCRSKMRHVRAPGPKDPVILDECPYDHGLWFDAGELEAILVCALGEEDAALARVRDFLGQFVGRPAGSEPQDRATDPNGREEKTDDD